ncbi:phosphatidylserine lipase ABHD16A-like, partial [Chiloscyllium plagiosum]|uniref:phosphatidylserine lipase ABHD16A-like n=1 Tax=Chiloscyllium plagiosum TaxID=36176 RepID=UPI001CB7F50D
MVGSLFRCVCGPRLKRIHRGTDSPAGFYYQPRALEKHSDSILGWAYILWSVSYYTSPLLLLYCYKKGYIVMSKILPVTSYASLLLLVLTGVVCLRGVGRWTNPEYVQFISVLEETKRNNTAENKKKLAHYSFDFSHWPEDFRWDEVSSQKDHRSEKQRKVGVPLLKPEVKSGGTTGSSLFTQIFSLPCQVIGYLMAHSFGRRMLYPGSVSLLQKAIMPMLLQGQARLMEEYRGKRAKLIACDGNQIDTVFVDRRASENDRGKKL